MKKALRFTKKIVDFNEFVSNLEGVEVTLLPIRDGLYIIRKVKEVSKKRQREEEETVG